MKDIAGNKERRGEATLRMTSRLRIWGVLAAVLFAVLFNGVRYGFSTRSYLSGNFAFGLLLSLAVFSWVARYLANRSFRSKF